MLRHFALALAALIATSAVAEPQQTALTWRNSAEHFGAFSGLSVSADGTRFIAISDRGHIATGTLSRSEGQLSAATLETLSPLLTPAGAPVGGRDFDAEGLAVAPDGTLRVSFESNHRVWAYAGPDQSAQPLPIAAEFPKLQDNSGLEALFFGPDDALYALPERSGQLMRPFPVYRFDGTGWSTAFTLPRRPPHLPVGADMGPDGRLYLLERDFRGLRGFSSRVRSFAFTPRGLADERTVFTSRLRAYDNLEGISVWQDQSGAIRLTMISDDNMNFFQRTEWVEVTLPVVPALRPRLRPPA